MNLDTQISARGLMLRTLAIRKSNMIDKGRARDIFLGKVGKVMIVGSSALLMTMTGILGYNGYKMYSAEREFKSAKEMISSEDMVVLDNLKNKYDTMSKNTDSSYIPKNKYMYGELMAMIESGLPSNFYVTSVEGVLTTDGVYDYKVGIKAQYNETVGSATVISNVTDSLNESFKNVTNVKVGLVSVEKSNAVNAQEGVYYWETVVPIKVGN